MYYYSENGNNDRILIEQIVIAIAKDYEHESLFCIKIITTYGTKQIWDYRSKELRDKELKEINELVDQTRQKK